MQPNAPFPNAEVPLPWMSKLQYVEYSSKYLRPRGVSQNERLFNPVERNAKREKTETHRTGTEQGVRQSVAAVRCGYYGPPRKNHQRPSTNCKADDRASPG